MEQLDYKTPNFSGIPDVFLDFTQSLYGEFFNISTNYFICTHSKKIRNMTKPTLLILAAGMGSRYGGLKQMDEFGPNGETILDYSIYDAIAAGFGKIVFVIRESFKEDFKKFFAGKFDGKVEVAYVTQDITMVPEGSTYRDDREKPWGTAHAVHVARHEIDGPFAVINADDFYGGRSYKVLVDFFNETADSQSYALVGYRLANTLSEHGTVNRGVCATSPDGNLENIVETLKIGYDEDGKIFYNDEHGAPAYLEADTPVSMNMWAFTTDYFEYCESMFTDFLRDHGDELKSEFFIPLLVDELIKSGDKQVRVLDCDEEWFGVTYQEDKPIVIEKLQALIDSGVYPANLWG